MTEESEYEITSIWHDGRELVLLPLDSLDENIEDDLKQFDNCFYINRRLQCPVCKEDNRVKGPTPDYCSFCGFEFK